jgi:hypothetical protein
VRPFELKGLCIVVTSLGTGKLSDTAPTTYKRYLAAAYAKSLAAVAFTIVFATCSFAQGRAARFGVSTYGSGTGFGRVLFPGTGHPPAVGSIGNTTFASRIDAPVPGFAAQCERRRSYSGQTLVAIPYPTPVYVGGPDYEYGQQPNTAIADAPPEAPPIVMEPDSSLDRPAPVTHEYSDDSSGSTRMSQRPSTQAVDILQEQPTSYYFIALKDHSIYSAFAYWVENDTLHYVTLQRVHNQASLTLVDRELTEKLNHGRDMSVELPQ